MNKFSLLLVVGVALMVTSCVSKKDFQALQENKDLLQSSLTKANEKLSACEDEKMGLQGKITELEGTISSQNSTISGKDSKINSLMGDLETEKKKRDAIFTSLSDLNVMTAEEVAQFKATMDKISMMPAASRKKALTNALAERLKSSLGSEASEDIEITTKGGAVLLSLSDKVLFQAGRSALNKDSKAILAEIAKVIQSNSSIEVLVEGHTDSDPISLTSSRDNWDLSLRRAAKVVRYFQKEHEVAPNRLVAAGRGEHDPKADNETKEGKAMNRRTEIMLIPGLDEYFRLASGK